jgi:two-component system nitrate/nitrite response regulator NarL
VLAGEPVISPEMMAKLLIAFRARAAAAPTALPDSAPADSGAVLEKIGLALLSAREREVLALIAQGDSNKLIARHLAIAEATVKIHVQNILRKLQLSSRVQAAVYATAPAAGLTRINKLPH